MQYLAPFGGLVPTSLLLVAAAVGTFVNACSMPQGWRSGFPTITDKVLKATNVIYGEVRQTYVDPRFDYGSGSKAYTAEMDVLCVLKGQQTDPIINITEAGHVLGRCHTANLVIGKRYIILADKDINSASSYTTYSSEIEATDEKLKNVTRACGLQQIYPNGAESSKVECPTPLPPGECVSTVSTVIPSGGSDPDYNDKEPGEHVNQDITWTVEPSFTVFEGESRERSTFNRMTSSTVNVVVIIVISRVFLSSF